MNKRQIENILGEKMGILVFAIGVVMLYSLYFYGMSQLEGWYMAFLAMQGL